MSANSSIEWTNATWNPVQGCAKVSPGCDNCYAERIFERFHGKGSFATVRRDEQDKLYLPFRWRKPRMIFVNSMSDLFHDDVPDSFIANVFSVMARTPRHTYQILTKRHGRMRSLLNRPSFRDNLADMAPDAGWPLSNVWLGVSVEDQKRAELRIPALQQTPATVRWLSCEPLIGPVDLVPCADFPDVDWVVAGGESGPGARPMHPDWARTLRDQCVIAGVPFFFKQWGAWVPDFDGNWGEGNGRRLHYPRIYLRPDGTAATFGDGRGPGTCMDRVPKKVAGRLLDGRVHDAFPQVTGVSA